MDEYRDSNNYIMKNSGRNMYSRVFMNSEVFSAYDYQMGPTWISPSPLIREYNLK